MELVKQVLDNLQSSNKKFNPATIRENEVRILRELNKLYFRKDPDIFTSYEAFNKYLSLNMPNSQLPNCASDKTVEDILHSLSDQVIDIFQDLEVKEMVYEFAKTKNPDLYKKTAI
jgi:hypothetical protein